MSLSWLGRLALRLGFMDNVPWAVAPAARAFLERYFLRARRLQPAGEYAWTAHVAAGGVLRLERRRA